METRRLYYEDCLIREFTAIVTSCQTAEQGYLITLDATAFYPEGGGQACDLGTLGDVNVLDVQERDGNVLHLCDKPLPVGSSVTGQLDWDRRFDLMQQHAGEHILSGLIYQKYGYHNVGFHVGRDVMEVDFDGPIPSHVLMELEAAANQVVWEDVAIHCYVPDLEELSKVKYRTKKALPWPVRIVDIPGCDTCACCGIHVARTGQIGLIKILSCVKFHQGVRLEMVCGKRAYNYMCRAYEQNRQISQLLSAKILETAPAVQRINDQLTEEKYRAACLEKRVFSAIAAAYIGKGHVQHFEDSLSASSVRGLAETIADVCDGTAAVFSGSDSTGYTLCLSCKNGDVHRLGQMLTQALHGRGGGKPGAFQGRVQATRKEIEDFLRNR